MKKIKLFRCIEDIKPKLWDRFTKDKGLYYTRNWLISNQYAFSDEVIYFCIFEYGELCAVAISSFVHKKIKWDYYNVDEMIGDYCFPSEKYLLVGVPFGYCNGLICNNVSLLKLLHDVMIEYSERNNISGIAIIHSDSDFCNNKMFSNYCKSHSCQDAYFNVSKLNGDYANYISTVSPRRFRKENMPFINSDFTCVYQDDFSEIAPNLAKLEGNLLSKYGFEEDLDLEYAASWFQNINSLYGDDSIVYLLYYKGKVVGFSLFIFNQGCAYFKTCGFDYKVIPKTVYAYFNLVYYIPMRDFVNLKRVYYGVGTISAKKQRGSTVVDKYLMVRTFG